MAALTGAPWAALASSGLPRGVIRTGSAKIKFQGRINYKPPDSGRGRQRAIGTFDTAEEAGLAVAEAEAKLKEQLAAFCSAACKEFQ